MSTDHPYVVQICVRPKQRSDDPHRFLGTGCIFNTSSSVAEVLTAWHVVEGYDKDDLWVRGGWFGLNPRKVETIRSNSALDVAVLVLHTSLRSNQIPPLLAKEWRDPTNPQAADLKLIGYADLNANADSFPVGLAVGQDGPTNTWKVEGARAKGFSGAPAIVNGQVELIALVRNDNQGVTFLRHVSELRSLTHPSVGSRDDISRNLVDVIDDLYRPLAQKVLLNRHRRCDEIVLKRRQLLNEGFRYFLSAATSPVGSKENAMLDSMVRPSSNGVPFATRLQGRRGSGTTTVLASLNAILWLDADLDSAAALPLFLNLRLYEGIGTKTAKLTDDVGLLKRAIDGSGKRSVILVIDGLDAFGGHDSALLLARLFEETPQRLAGVVASGTSSEFVAFVRQLYSRINLADAEEPHATFLLSDYVLKKGKLSDDEEDTEEDSEFTDLCQRAVQVDRVLYDKDLRISPPSDDPVVKDMMTALKSFDVPGITSPLQKLLIDSLDAGERLPDNLAVFLGDVCRNRYENIYSKATTQRVAFRLLHEEYGSKGTAPPIKLDPQAPGNDDTAYKELAGDASILRDYIVASGIVEDLSRAENPRNSERAVHSIFESQKLDYDFPESVNFLCRLIIAMKRGNRIVEVLLLATNNCNKWFGEPRFFRAMNFFTYLVARVSETGDQSVIKTLNGVIAVVDGYLKANTTNNDGDKIRWMAARRTAEVSLIRIDAEGAGKRYIHTILSDSLSDQVNRNFHRLYYGDILPTGDPARDYYDPVKISPVAGSGGAVLDNVVKVTLSWRSAQNALIRGIEQGLINAAGGKHPKWNFQVQLATLLAFIRSENNISQIMSNSRLRDTIKAVVENIHSDKLILYSPLRAALDVLVRDLADDGQRSPWRSIIDIYALKYEARQGWLKRGLKAIDPGTRTESVAEHVFFATKLAALLLPLELPAKRLEEESGYDRAMVIEMLLDHDDAEALIGDWIVVDDDDLRKEVRRSELAAIGVIDASTSALRADALFRRIELFERFESQSCINGRLARDFDCFENLLQLGVYWKWKRLSDEQYQLFCAGLLRQIGDDRGGIRTRLKNHALDFLNYIQSASEREMFWSSSFDHYQKRRRFDQGIRSFFTDGNFKVYSRVTS